MLLLVTTCQAQNTTTPTPVVLWHGMGDTCCFPFSMGHIKRLIEKRVPHIHVHSLMIGSNIIADEEHGYFGDVNEQVQEVCDKIANDTKLKDGYHAMGFSQGGQFLRAVAERCPQPPIKNLITLGGQHQGVFGLPNCPPNDTMCEEVRRLLDLGAYFEYIQHTVVQAQYWHDPLNEALYAEMSFFLADINNERDFNSDYKENLQKLENFVMVKFTEDSMVVPVESEWFGFYTPNQDVEVLPLQQTDLYIEDNLGLKAMDKAGKLQFLSVDGDHLQFDDQWFLEEIVDKYIA